MDSAGKVVPKAVYSGLATLAFLYFGFYFFIGSIIGNETIALMFWGQILLLTVSGYVAGYLAKRNGTINGLMVGLAAPVVLSIGMSIATMQLNIAAQAFSGLGVFWLVQSVILCSLGGFIWDVQSKFRS